MGNDVHMPDDARYRVCFVCSGNICRSPMAEYVMRALVEDAGLGDRVVIDSAGTGDWHIGERADRRTIAALSGAGYDAAAHRAQQFDPHWFARRDLIIALDRGHLRTLRSWAPSDHDRDKIRLLRSFDPELGPSPAAADSDVADPYYSGMSAFTDSVTQIERACRGLLGHLQSATAGRIAG
jgi:protein-tyrosine phosphatase